MSNLNKQMVFEFLNLATKRRDLVFRDSVGTRKPFEMHVSFWQWSDYQYMEREELRGREKDQILPK